MFQGRVPASEYQRMRAPFQAGELSGAGEVRLRERRDGRARAARLCEGRDVFVLYPHQTRYVVPADAVHVLPDDVPPERAVLAANLETAINGLWDARPHVGDRIAVVGAGTVGCLVAWLAAPDRGCDVELVDINPQRAAIARALGVRFAAPRRGERRQPTS